MARTWPRRAATCTARAAVVSPDGDGSGGLVTVLLAVRGGRGGAAAGEVGDDLRRTGRTARGWP